LEGSTRFDVLAALEARRTDRRSSYYAPPEDVAGSLAAREDSTRAAASLAPVPDSGLARRAPRIVIRSTKLRTTPQARQAPLGSDQTPPPAEQTLAEIRRFVDPALRHYHPPQGEAGPAMRLAHAAHALLIADLRDVVDPFFRLLSNCWRVEGLVADKGDRPPDWSALFGDLDPSAVELSEALRHVRRESA
jgi:hypothetical protein